MISGGIVEIDSFTEGWALSRLNGKAHYFQGKHWPEAVCGADVFPFMHIGDWTACKRCVAKQGVPTIQQREHGRNALAEMALLRAIETQGV